MVIWKLAKPKTMIDYELNLDPRDEEFFKELSEDDKKIYLDLLIERLKALQEKIRINDERRKKELSLTRSTETDAGNAGMQPAKG